MTAMVEFLGADSKSYVVQVAYWAEFPRNRRGACAFCDGDPCGERSPENARINRHRRRAYSWFQTCPVCDGRPT
jgi:hypothetical protein